MDVRAQLEVLLANRLRRGSSVRQARRVDGAVAMGLIGSLPDGREALKSDELAARRPSGHRPRPDRAASREAVELRGHFAVAGERQRHAGVQGRRDASCSRSGTCDRSDARARPRSASGGIGNGSAARFSSSRTRRRRRPAAGCDRAAAARCAPTARPDWRPDRSCLPTYSAADRDELIWLPASMTMYSYCSRQQPEHLLDGRGVRAPGRSN